jgi:hypothetical protein
MANRRKLMISGVLILALSCEFSLFHHKSKPQEKPKDDQLYATAPGGERVRIEEFCTTLSDGTIIFGPPDGGDMFGTGKTCKDAANDYKTSVYSKPSWESRI